MKIICSGCGSRHWLSDMQVSNGGCNVVCPHCSTANYADASMIDPASKEARWYYAVNDDTVGPLSAQDLEFNLQNGQITLDSYVWCEGFPDWMLLRAVSDFDYLSSPVEGSPLDLDEATRVAGEGGFGFGAFNSMSNGEETAAIDLSEFEASGYSPFDQGSSAGIMGMDGKEAVDDSSAQPPMDMGPVTSAANELVGARSENSVLFSLSSLQAVSVSPAASGSASSGSSAPVTAGGNAGLIDVKALASSSAPRRRANEVVDSFGGSSLPMATVLPVSNKADSDDTKKILLIGGIVSAIIIVIVVLIIAVHVVSSGNEEKVQDANVQAAAVEAEKAKLEFEAKKAELELEAEKAKLEVEKAKLEAAAAEQAAAEKAAAAEQAAAEQAAADTAAADTAAAAKKSTGTTKKSDSGSSAKKTAETTTAKAESAPAAKKTETKKAAAAAPAAGGNDLTKSEIQTVIRGIGAQIRTCSRSSAKKGKMSVKFTIKGDGRVAGASVVSPEFANTPTASCVLKVVNTMKFRAAGKDVPITYPFQIQ